MLTDGEKCCSIEKQLLVTARGPLAQLAEHLTFNQVVPRSNRGWLTIRKISSF